MPLLHWLTRDEDLTAADRVPFRLLEEAPDLGAGEPSENLLVQGDNLEALKALLPFYAGQVKCIYIDPPYNTGSAFEHYDDSLEHAKWLAMMVPRLQLLREFLSEDGSIWVSIDNREGHYLKVLMDEVFGRRFFQTCCVWQQRTTRENRKVFSEDTEYILVYARMIQEKYKMIRNQLNLSDAVLKRYKNPDNDPRGVWQSISLNAQDGHATKEQIYNFVSPNGKVHKLPSGRCWLYTWPEMQRKIAKGLIWFGKSGNNVPREKMFLNKDDAGLTPNTLWLASESSTNDAAKKETIKLFGDAVFETPKPEKLISRIVEIVTNPGDLVLDSFLGSGTTAAVAHKMGRRWIGVELGDHARSHCALRLRKVIEGEQGGISEAVGWKGGGGFRFATLGEAAFMSDGRINPAIRFGDLARHIWFAETRTPMGQSPTGPFLGAHDGKGLALLYNGVLKDRSPSGGNVLTHAVLRHIRDMAGAFDGPMTIYGTACRLSAQTLEANGVVFRQIPYDVSART